MKNWMKYSVVIGLLCMGFSACGKADKEPGDTENLIAGVGISFESENGADSENMIFMDMELTAADLEGMTEQIVETRKHADIYAKPSKDAAAIGAVDEGMEIGVYGLTEDTKWMVVSFNGRIGYVEADVFEREVVETQTVIVPTTPASNGGNQASPGNRTEGAGNAGGSSSHTGGSGNANENVQGSDENETTTGGNNTNQGGSTDGTGNAGGSGNTSGSGSSSGTGQNPDGSGQNPGGSDAGSGGGQEDTGSGNPTPPDDNTGGTTPTPDDTVEDSEEGEEPPQNTEPPVTEGTEGESEPTEPPVSEAPEQPETPPSELPENPDETGSISEETGE